MSNQTFSAAFSLDNDSVIVPDIWDHHGKHSSSHPLFWYASGEASASGSVITWGEGIRAMHAAGRIILDALVKDSVFSPGTHNGERPVIAILAVSDMITAWASITGVIRAGFPVLLLSPRNSPSALAHLLKSTKCRLLVHSTDKFVAEVLAETSKLLRESGEAPMSLCQLPSYSETYGRQDPVQPLPRLSNVHPNDLAIILHTSGSTSFPKPRMISHRTFLQVSKYYYAQGIDMSGKILGQFALPFFHIFGGMTALGFPTVSGMVMGVFAPTVPPTVPTPQRVLDASVACKAHVLFVVPSFCESWSSDEQAVERLSSINTVIFGGGPLNKRVGDILVKKGVNLHLLYGSTELGAVSAHPIDIPSNDWEYFKIAKQINAELVREDGPEDAYELVVAESHGLCPCTFNTKISDRPAYATGDLLARHPTNPELWRVVGRKDDQIMHSNGEKTNPGPIESVIVKHPAVRRVLMFGRERFNPGIIIEPIEEVKDEESRTAFIDEIWPNVEEANARAPTHSRIFREMIVIANPAKPFKVTPKQSLKRPAILDDYSDEIDEAYRTFQESVSSMDTVSPPNSWNEADCVGFIHAAVARILGHNLKDDDDFFQSGFNSLEAVYLRSTIARAFQRTGVNLPFETSPIYDFPTAASLGKFISESVTGNVADPDTTDRRARQLLSLVERYTAHFPQHIGMAPLPERETVLVTGTTGSLGINVLKTLISLDSVHRVYAFNRKGSSGGKSRDRHLSAAQLQGIDESLVDSPKVVYLEGDITLVNMGLPDDVIQELRRTLTSVLHLAWKVDFNMSLKSFIPQLQGMRNLIDLSLSSDLKKVPPLVFASSISDLQNFSGEDLIPATVNPDPKTAIGMGYGESKWVASRILETARQVTPLRPVIVRIGQLCGNNETGSWNPWEWFPTIVRSAKAIGSVPELQGEVSWIPVDVAASTMVDLRQAGDRASIANLVHPQPVDSKAITGEIARSLSLPVKPYTVWLEDLKRIKDTTAFHGKQALQEVPALKLFDFYQSLASEPAGGRTAIDAMQLRLDVVQTVQLSETLSGDNVRPLEGNDAVRWLKCWGIKVTERDNNVI